MDSNNGTKQWSRASEEILKNRYPMHKACREGDIESVSLLVVSGQQNLLQEDEFYGWTPAHWAAYFGKLACLRRIIQSLSSEPMSSRYQQTPVHLAAYAGHPQCLAWLLNSGSDISKVDYLGETAVHKAARTGSMECVSLLAERRADLNAKNNVGLTPYNLAAQCGFPDCTLYLKRVADQQLLKEQGAIAEMVFPVVHSQTVLPGQCPDRAVMAQGLNGGCLPHSIDSNCLTRDDQGMDMDCPMDSQGDHFSNGIANGNSMQNGFSFGNGHGDGFPNGTNGFSCINGLHKDVTMSQDVSLNRATVAGRKRGREVLDEDLDDWKRARRPEIEAFPELRLNAHPFISYLASRH
ncbi:ankyrin repeat domain-containing protein 10-like isoform X2 [Watersipora subatra]|uniref:ankyrin repeat domain-containing protein 10-like isoform X2 n=1 Tax=Watersipora subatra TaxID=2589382 RepID=UPI00355B383B